MRPDTWVETIYCTKPVYHCLNLFAMYQNYKNYVITKLYPNKIFENIPSQHAIFGCSKKGSVLSRFSAVLLFNSLRLLWLVILKVIVLISCHSTVYYTSSYRAPPVPSRLVSSRDHEQSPTELSPAACGSQTRLFIWGVTCQPWLNSVAFVNYNNRL